MPFGVKPAAVAEPSASPTDTLQVAACALLLEVAHADGDISTVEREHLDHALQRHFGLDRDGLEALVAAAETERQRAVDHFGFTRQLVQGYVTTVNIAGASGSFELNVSLPLLADVLLDGVRVLAGAVEGFDHRCVRGLEVDRERVERIVEQSLMLGTALAPHIGYDAAAKLAKEAYQSGRTIRELAEEKKLLPPAELEKVLDLRHMTEPGR